MDRSAAYRKELNEIDASLIELLGRRFSIIRDAGDYK
jgi:chorismate mutase